MENLTGKVSFLKNAYIPALQQLAPATAGKWGKMNVQQMVEHMSDYVRIASGKTIIQTITPEETLPRMQDFLKSEKPFRENTPNSLMADTPPTGRHPSLKDAIEELATELNYFFAEYAKEPHKQVPNPFFGMLGYDMQVQLLYKHATHHLRQFGVEI